jgi:transcriptional regulator with XRE-family HTH domain
MSTGKGKFMPPLGERLKEERERLGLSQTNFAKIAETTKKTVFSWETGKTAPSGFQLVSLAAAGVDTHYILTGTRNVGDLTPEEVALVDNFRNSPEVGKEAIRRTSFALAQPGVKGEAA